MPRQVHLAQTLVALLRDALAAGGQNGVEQRRRAGKPGFIGLRTAAQNYGNRHLVIRDFFTFANVSERRVADDFNRIGECLNRDL
jgi:hypothetical protein